MTCTQESCVQIIRNKVKIKFNYTNSMAPHRNGGYTPITFLLIKKDTPAVSASAIQKAFHTLTAPKK